MTYFEQWIQSMTIESWAQKFVELDYCPKCPAYQFCHTTDIVPKQPINFEHVNKKDCDACCIKRFKTWATTEVK